MDIHDVTVFPLDASYTDMDGQIGGLHMIGFCPSEQTQTFFLNLLGFAWNIGRVFICLTIIGQQIETSP